MAQARAVKTEIKVTQRRNVVLLLRRVKRRTEQSERDIETALKMLLLKSAKRDKRKRARLDAKNSRTEA